MTTINNQTKTDGRPKHCATCRDLLPADAFRFDRRTLDGLSRSCIYCLERRGRAKRDARTGTVAYAEARAEYWLRIARERREAEEAAK